jgi:hypothetical protein
MMASKVFLKAGGNQLISDERDIMVAARYRSQVIQWCRESGVEVEDPQCNYTHDIAQKMFGVNIWRIRDEQQRVLFALRWAG